MQELAGQGNGPVFIVHAGAGNSKPQSDRMKRDTEVLLAIARRGIKRLKSLSAVEFAAAMLKVLEDEPSFNAGRGSALQGDGQARLSAALMDGHRQSFSGVILASYIRNPSAIALRLQNETFRVLSGPGVELMARKMGIKPQMPHTPARIQAWLKNFENGKIDGFDTVGCVVRASSGRLASGTSTGGRGNEIPGRVSDSATIAGNYATSYAAISCTGIGEEIVDDAVAARIEARVRDGMSLIDASRKTYFESSRLKRDYGWISLDSKGGWAIGHVSPSMVYVVMQGDGKILSKS